MEFFRNHLPILRSPTEFHRTPCIELPEAIRRCAAVMRRGLGDRQDRPQSRYLGRLLAEGVGGGVAVVVVVVVVVVVIVVVVVEV